MYVNGYLYSLIINLEVYTEAQLLIFAIRTVLHIVAYKLWWNTAIVWAKIANTHKHFNRNAKKGEKLTSAHNESCSACMDNQDAHRIYQDNLECHRRSLMGVLSWIDMNEISIEIVK